MRFSIVLAVALGCHLCHPCAHADIHSLLRQLTAAPAQTPHPAIARVQVLEQGAVSQGSGALIGVDDTYGWVITNWHVVRGDTGDITVSFPGGYQSPAIVMKTDQDWDLALLAIHPPSLAPLPMAANVPAVGESLYIAGYGQGKFRVAQGSCLGYAAPETGFPEEMIDVSVAARQGDSGGPIVNTRGQLAGVLFGSGQGVTTGTHVGRVRQFLAELSTEVPSTSLAEAHHTIAGQPMTSHRAPRETQSPADLETVGPRTPELVASVPSSPSETASAPGYDARPGPPQAAGPSSTLASELPFDETPILDFDQSLTAGVDYRPRTKSAWTETQAFLAFIVIVGVVLLVSPGRQRR